MGQRGAAWGTTRITSEVLSASVPMGDEGSCRTGSIAELYLIYISSVADLVWYYSFGYFGVRSEREDCGV